MRFSLITTIFAMLLSNITMSFGALANRSQPQIAQPWPNVQLVQASSGFSLPVDITNAGDGSGRLFVVEQAGRIKIVKMGTISGIFLDISSRVRSPANGGGGEQGLLNVVFPPGYGTRLHHFYVYYTSLTGDNRLSRFSLGANADQADPNSEEILIVFPHSTYTNHNGGQLAFGPDGYLYIGTGDGGGGGDPLGNAQNHGTLLGKILRIDVDPPAPVPGTGVIYLPLIYKGSNTSTAIPYAIPPTNPFVNTPGYRKEIWALGLRNPWRFSFDRQTGDLWIGDVGQNNWEEVDFQLAASSGGENYGWNVLEGDVCYSNSNCNPAGFTPPVWVYNHTNGKCSITGGFVYRGAAYPGLQGIYFFADYCSGEVWGLRQESGVWQNNLFQNTTYNISTFGEDEAGELYLADLASGIIYRIVQGP